MVRQLPRGAAVTRKRGGRMAAAIATVVASVFWPSNAAAQGTVLAVEGGATVSSVTGVGDQFGPTTRTRGGVGIVAGVGVQQPLGRVLTFAPEIVYSERRFERDVPDIETGERVIVHTTLQYLEVPLLVRIGAAGGHGRAFFAAGPSIAWLLRAPQTLDYYGFSAFERSFDAASSPYDLFRRWNASAAFGGGLRLDAVEVEARVDVGLIDIHGSSFDQTHLPASRTRGGALILRWRF